MTFEERSDSILKSTSTTIAGIMTGGLTLEQAQARYKQLRKLIAENIEAAVLHERERCAQEAEAEAQSWMDASAYKGDSATKIASGAMTVAIRIRNFKDK